MTCSPLDIERPWPVHHLRRESEQTRSRLPPPGDAGEVAGLVNELHRRGLSGGRCRDLACCSGRHLEHLQRVFDCEGLDLEPELLARAVRRVPQARLHQADMLDFKLPERQFDLITCFVGSKQALDGVPETIQEARLLLALFRVLSGWPGCTLQSQNPPSLKALSVARAKPGVMEKVGRAAFAFVFVSVVLDMLALGIMVPILPKLIVQFEAGDHARAAQMTGIFGFFWALMQFLASPVLGSLSDRFGRRPVLLLSSLGLGLDYVLMALAPNLLWLFVGRLISGVTAATFATASAYIADITPAEQRAGRFGLLGAAFGVGFIVGPAVGGLLGQYSLRLPFWVAAACSLLNTLYGLFVLPESLPPDKRTSFQWKVANPWGSLRFLTGYPGLSGLALAAFLYYLAHEALPSMFVLYTDYRFHWSERTVGLVLGAVGVGSMVVSATMTRRLVARWGESSTLLLGLACGLSGFALYAASARPFVFLAGLPLVSLSGVTGPSLQGLFSRQIEATQQGQLQGALSSLRGVAGMIGPLLFTQSFKWASARPGWPIGLPYYLAAGLLGAGLLLALTSHQNRGRTGGG